MIDHIIVIDDKCPQGSGRIANEIADDRIMVIYREHNGGVGAAVISGYKKALELGCDIMIKMDGDGQMDPKHIEPLIQDQTDYTKGNRFMDFAALRKMPRVRLIGNNILSFWEKMFSGYWNIMDPTNGYTSIHRRVLEKLNLDKISKGYFFESDMLVNLNLVGAVVEDIAIPSRYGDENSYLSVWKSMPQFPPLLPWGLAKRIFLEYFISVLSHYKLNNNNWL